MYFVGNTRFSLAQYNSRSWKAISKFGSEKEYLDYLYSPERMDVRRHIFFDLSLKQLEVASRGHDLRHIVSYSSVMPDRYKEELFQASQAYDFLVLDEEVDQTTSVSRQEVCESFIPAGTIFGAYRVDDDDILPVNYFDEASQYLKDSFVGFALSFSRGVSAIYSGGRFSFLRESDVPKHAVGLMVICDRTPDGRIRIFGTGPHSRVDRRMPVILDARKPMYWWTRHLAQDTTYAVADVRYEIMQSLAEYPPLQNMAEVRRGFPFVESVSLSARTTLVDKQTPIPSEGVSFALQRPESVFTVLVKLDYSQRPNGRNAILRFAIDGAEDGREIPNLGYSHRPDIGYFRYVGYDTGERYFSVSLSLPEGCSCSGLGMRPWRDPHVTLLELVVESESEIA